MLYNIKMLIYKTTTDPEILNMKMRYLTCPNIGEKSSLGELTSGKKFLEEYIPLGLIHATLSAIPSHHLHRLDSVGGGDLGST